MLPRTALLFALVANSLSAQSPDDALSARSEALCAALRSWADGFSRSSFKLTGRFLIAEGQGPTYLREGLEAGLFRRSVGGAPTHHSSLLYLVGQAERRPGAAIAAAMLPLAAAGYERDLYGHQTVMVRDAAHFALLRMNHPSVWEFLERAALGRTNAGSAEAGAGLGSPQRVAAIKLLGMKRARRFRKTVEKCLLATDSMIRLAASEALEFMCEPAGLAVLTRAIGSERHPVVAQALVAALDRTMRKHRASISDEQRHRAITATIRVLGLAGWRTDLTVVRLMRSHPAKIAIPALIRVMRGLPRRDRLLDIINEKASPVLAHEAWISLRRMTGALVPADPDRWQEFWNREQHRLEMVQPRGDQRPASATRAKGSFFGIPVVGREVVFVIDASGSMKELVRHTVTKSPKGKRGRARPGSGAGPVKSRLSVAKQQVLHAAAGIGEGTRYHLITFADKVQIWNHKPVPAKPSTHKTLTEVLGRIEADGGTNAFAALLYVLNASQIVYGQRVKNRVDEVFVLSDGEPSVGQVKDPEKILRLVQELNRYQKIRINTVFSGHGKGVEFMRKLAEENHGVFVWNR